VRSVLEAAVVGGLTLAAACSVWRGRGEREGLLIGGASAWAVSSISTAALLVAKAHLNPKAFWYAFGGGAGLRFLMLAALMTYGALHERAFSLPALLFTYAVGVLFFLMLEYRHIKIK
jgi:hypothetical protein